MKYRLLACTAAIIFLLSFCASAQVEEQDGLLAPEKAWEDLSEDEKFREDPQLAFEENPTAANLGREGVVKTLVNFGRLDRTEQGYYLIRNYRTDFAQEYLRYSNFDSSDSSAIASFFFSEKPENLNSNKDTFERYAASEGVTIDVIGNVRSYSINGFLRGINQEINVIQFRDQYSFRVAEDGSVSLFDKAGMEYSFEGSIRKGEDGRISLKEGTIVGKRITDGVGIRLGVGMMAGSAGSIDGLVFERPADFEVNLFVSEEDVFLKDAKITSVSPDANARLRVKNVVITTSSGTGTLNEGQFGVRDGQLYVPKGKFGVKDGSLYKLEGNVKTMVDYFEVTGTDTDVDLFFDGFEHSLDSKAYFSVNSGKQRMAVGYAQPPKEISFELEDMGKEKLRFVAVIPRAGNRIFDVKKNDNLAFVMTNNCRLEADVLMPGVNPRVVISVGKGAEGIQKSGVIFIQNGNTNFVFSGNTALKQAGNLVEAHQGNVPMTIEGSNEAGFIFGTEKEPKKLVITDYGAFGTIPATAIVSDVDEEFMKMTVSESMTDTPALMSLDLSINPALLMRNVQIVGGGDALKGKRIEEVLTPEQKILLISAIEFVPESIWETRKIVVYSDHDFHASAGDFTGGTMAYATKDGMHIPISFFNAYSPYALFHECIHNWDKKYIQSGEGAEWRRAWSELDNSYGKDRYSEPLSASLFPDIESFTDVYAEPGTESKPEPEEEKQEATVKQEVIPVFWADKTSEPRYGKVEAYSETNDKEDIATTAPYIVRNPNIYAQLIDPQSDFYKQRMGKSYETGVMDEQMARRWSDIYLGKFSLCEQAGLLTREQVNSVQQKLPGERRSLVLARKDQVMNRIGYRSGTGTYD